MEEKDNLTC